MTRSPWPQCPQRFGQSQHRAQMPNTGAAPTTIPRKKRHVGGLARSRCRPWHGPHHSKWPATDRGESRLHHGDSGAVGIHCWRWTTTKSVPILWPPLLRKGRPAAKVQGPHDPKWLRSNQSRSTSYDGVVSTVLQAHREACDASCRGHWNEDVASRNWPRPSSTRCWPSASGFARHSFVLPTSASAEHLKTQSCPPLPWK